MCCCLYLFQKYFWIRMTMLFFYNAWGQTCMRCTNPNLFRHAGFLYFVFFFRSKIFFANLTLQFLFFIFLKRIFIRGISTSNKNILCLFECLKPDTHKSQLVKNKKINQKCANYKKNFSKKKKKTKCLKNMHKQFWLQHKNMMTKNATKISNITFNTKIFEKKIQNSTQESQKTTIM